MARKNSLPLGTFLKRISSERRCQEYHRCAGRGAMFALNADAVMGIGCPTGDTSVPNAAIRPR